MAPQWRYLKNSSYQYIFLEQLSKQMFAFGFGFDEKKTKLMSCNWRWFSTPIGTSTVYYIIFSLELYFIFLSCSLSVAETVLGRNILYLWQCVDVYISILGLLKFLFFWLATYCFGTLNFLRSCRHTHRWINFRYLAVTYENVYELKPFCLARLPPKFLNYCALELNINCMTNFILKVYQLIGLIKLI